jgi:hypothetical protein
MSSGTVCTHYMGIFVQFVQTIIQQLQTLLEAFHASALFIDHSFTLNQHHFCLLLVFIKQVDKLLSVYFMHADLHTQVFPHTNLLKYPLH